MGGGGGQAISWLTPTENICSSPVTTATTAEILMTRTVNISGSPVTAANSWNTDDTNSKHFRFTNDNSKQLES